MSRNHLLHTEKLAIGYQTKKNGELRLHGDINLTLSKGEITCLLGPNGTGKSTLLRTLAGFQKPLSGEIWLGNEELNQIANREISQKISVVLTEQVEVGNMFVFDMVAYGRSPYTGFLGRLSESDRSIVIQALRDTGIEHLHQRRFAELSDGERQKVMIAKSLAQQTDIIFLDEPTAFLDFPSKVEILQLLRKAAWEHNKTILLSTHDLNLAIQFADNIWLMGKDQPLQKGVPEDLILQGHFGDFFDRETIRFDKRSGNFDFEVIHRKNVSVAGEGLLFDWLIRALKRKGYHPEFSGKAQYAVEVKGEKIFATEGNLQKVFSSIAEILAFLDN